MSCWDDSWEKSVMVHCANCFLGSQYTVCQCSCHSTSTSSSLVGYAVGCGCGLTTGCPGVSVCKCSCHTPYSSQRKLEELADTLIDVLREVKDTLKAMERHLRNGR